MLTSPDELEALEETLEIMSDPRLMAEIARARAEIAVGEIVELTELRRS